MTTAEVQLSALPEADQLASIIAGGPSPFIATTLFAAFASSFPMLARQPIRHPPYSPAEGFASVARAVITGAKGT